MCQRYQTYTKCFKYTPFELVFMLLQVSTLEILH